MVMNFISGLLGEEDKPKTPQQQALTTSLLAAGLQGLAASGPSYTPTSLGQVLGQAGLTGMSVYGNALQSAQQAEAAQQLQQALTGGSGDRSDMADRYEQLGIQMSATDPQKANLYFGMAERMRGKSEKLTGNVANASLVLFGTADVSKLTDQQRQQALRYAQEQDISARRAGAPIVNVKYGQTFGTELAKNQAAVLDESARSAQGAVSTLDTVTQIEPLVAQAFTGPGATVQTVLAQVGEKLGVGGQNRQQVLQNTANLIKGAAQLELDAAAKMRGQGQITENERAILRKAESFDPTSATAAEINAILATLRQRAQKRITSHNQYLDRFIQTQPEAEQQLDLYRIRPPVPVRRVQ